ncbi:MAG: lipid ABC transporter permease/ATP-binding protein, partial [Betaproteobacteria bacterium]|nr:lipid ABC transporter permease/ATP-binding protein [Betaproteobacteria bacterium]
MTTDKLHDRQLYRRLLTYLKPYRKGFAGAVLAMALGGAVDSSLAWYLNMTMEVLFEQGQDQYALWASLGIVLIFFTSGLCHFAAGYGMQWVGNKLILDFRNQMFQRLIRLPVPDFDRYTSGTLMAKVTNDVINLQAAATSTLNALVRGSFTLIGLLTTMFVINWRLTLILFATVPVLALIIRAFGKRLRAIDRLGQAAHAGIVDVLQESIRGQKVIKIFGGEAHEDARFHEAANRIRSLNMKQSAAAAASTPFTHLIVSSAIALIMYLAASKQFGVGMSVAEFVTFIMAAAGMLAPIKGLTGVNEQMQKGLSAAESVFTLIDAPEEEDRGTVTMGRASGHLNFAEVSLQYANQPRPALNQVSLEI